MLIPFRPFVFGGRAIASNSTPILGRLFGGPADGDMYEFPPGQVPVRLTAEGAVYVAALADEEGRIVAYTHRSAPQPPA